jgi:hypothetical protein
MNALLSLFQKEPALAIGFANAVLLVAINFGVPINADQKLALDSLFGAVLAILAAVAIRSQVTPVATLAAPPPH